MKNQIIHYFVLIMFISLSIGCSDNQEMEEELFVTTSDLIGDWRSSNTMVNGKPIEDFIGTAYIASNILVFDEESRYTFNYNSGEWQIEENEISLENERDFKIIKYEGNVMTLESRVLEHQVYYDLEGIGAFEFIIVREDYHRK